MLVYFTCSARVDVCSDCARKSTPGRSEDEARAIATRDGWHLRPADRGGDLCPWHAGRSDP